MSLFLSFSLPTFILFTFLAIAVQSFIPSPSSLRTPTSLKASPSSNEQNDIKRIAVMTSGGDCPSLNACIRAIVKTAKAKNIEVIGLPTALPGLMQDNPDAFVLDDSYASTSMLTKGGSRLGGFVSSDYIIADSYSMDEKVSKISTALENLGIDGIIATGGDTSFDRIAQILDHAGGTGSTIPFVGIPKTVDNDIPSTIFALGFDSAVSVASNAIASIRDTAESHRRIMVVECMGREAGFLTLHAGIAGGADAILLPEFPIDEHALIQHVEDIYQQHQCCVIAVSESISLPQTGNKSSIYKTADGRSRFGGSAEIIARLLSESLHVDARHLVLGHLQRGGSPSSFDQVLATNLGSHAVNTLCSGTNQVFVNWNGKCVENVSLDEVRGVASKTITSEYPELVTAQSMGVYCGSVPVPVPVPKTKSRGES